MEETVRRKIASLLRLSRGGGSEAEATAAMQKAADLMQLHGVSEAEVEVETGSVALKTKRPGQRDRLLAVIAICTNCAALTKRDWKSECIFFGIAPGPVIAVYLVEVVNAALDRGIADFKQSDAYRRRRTTKTRKQAVKDFTAGMVSRLSARLLTLFEASIRDDQRKKANQVLDARYPRTAPAKLPDRKVRFEEAAAAGDGAGRKVQLAHGVNGGKPVALIGGAS